MLKKGCIDDLRSGALDKSRGTIIVPMCHYPRGISRKVIDAYIKQLAPDKKLLDDFHAERERLGGNHNAAFLSCDYQNRFTVSASGLGELERLARFSGETDVYLVCQCRLDQRCHRELLLLMARKWWGATTELRTFSYPDFEKRLADEPGWQS